MNKDGNDQDISAEPVPKKFIKQPAPGWGYTYFLRRGHLIKIGHSAIPKDRVSKLQCGFPDKLETLAVIPNTIINEPDAHEKFDHLRENGEWFRPEVDLMEFIEWANGEAAKIPKKTYPKPKKKPRKDEPERVKKLRLALEAYEEADDKMKPCIEFYLRKIFKATASREF